MNTNLKYVCIAAAFLTATAIAQEQVLEEVVVTAQKREQAITDVSLSVSAFTGDMARANGINRAQDVAFMVPNVDIKGSAQSEANPAITIRGIGMNNFNSNNNQSVGVYVNEVFLSSPGMMSLSMMDIERIEVLKGPQGTLYGRNSSGGAINIISARPTQELDGFANLSVGDYDMVRFEGAVGGGLSDTVSGRISVLYDKQGESFHTNALTGTDFGDSENTGVRGQLAYDGDRLSANLMVTVMNQDVANRPFTHFGMMDDAFSFVPCAAVDAGGLDNSACFDLYGYQNPHDPNGFEHDFDPNRQDEYRTDSDVVNATLRFDYDFANDVTLTSITGFIEQDRFYGENTWSQPLEFFAVTHDEDMDQFSQEFRLAGGSDRVNWVGGIFYSVDQIVAANEANSGDVFGALLGVNPITWNFDQETTAWAVFGSVDWLLSDTWTLVTGLRYTEEDVDFVGGTFGVDLTGDITGVPGTIFPFNTADTTFSDDNATYRVALEARPTDDFLGYASVSTGFKSGGFNGDFIIDPTGYEPFESETVTSYELGGKWTLGGGIAQLDAAIFFYDYKDIQTIVPATPPNPGFQLGNLDSADISGVDVDFQVLATENLTLRLGLGYLDTEVSDSRAGFDGAQLPNAPELQWTAGGRWDIPLSTNWSLALQADLKYADSTFRTVPNSPQASTESNTVANARIVLHQPDGQWEFAVWGRNITDESYFIEAFDVFDPLGVTAKLLGAPQVFGVSANFRFQ
jgi:iron complex outermembrane receptor protein